MSAISGIIHRNHRILRLYPLAAALLFALASLTLPAVADEGGAGRRTESPRRSLGAVTAWGANGNGQSSISPDLHDVAAVSGGYIHSLALKSDGRVVAWGDKRVRSGRSAVGPARCGRH